MSGATNYHNATDTHSTADSARIFERKDIRFELIGRSYA